VGMKWKNFDETVDREIQ